MLILPPLSLYVHIPWCVRKCPYCDFNSHEVRGEIPEALYVQALKNELDLSHPQVQGRKLSSIFFGGGTPSLFSAGAIGDLLEHAEAMIGFTDDIEITLEANPGATELQRFRDYRSAGVNRLSIGVQSFFNTHLQRLGRIHDRAAAIAAADAAHVSGFDNFNLDLMYGLPTQTVAQALDDLELATRLEPTHLSWYQLTIEPNTLFYKEPPPLPQEGVLEEIQEAGEEFLRSQSMMRYEVSAFAKQHRESRHNTNYWQFGDYLGIGAGAHGKITDLATQAIDRSTQPRMPKDYLAQATTGRRGHRQRVAQEELPVEFFMNALRLVEGVDRRLYSERTGLEFAPIENRWQRLVDLGLLAPADQKLTCTPKGFRFLDEVLQSLS